jgi:hypothetical protein
LVDEDYRMIWFLLPIIAVLAALSDEVK